MSVHLPILARCLRQARRVMMIDDSRSYRGIEILVAAAHVADLLERRCASRTVGLLLPTSGATAIACLGAWMAGKIAVPLNYLLKPEEQQFIVDDCGADAILAARPMIEFVGTPPRSRALLTLEDDVNFRSMPEPRWPARAAADDLAVLLYTSGTSGRPKGVMLSHGNLAANIDQVTRAAHFDHRDVLLGVLPQFHSFGLTVLTLLPLTIGARAVFTARFVPQRIVRMLREHRPTALVAIPSMYAALLRVKDASREDFASLRLVVSGAEPLPDAVAQGIFDRFGIRLNEGYGLTETSPVTNVCLPGEYRPRSVGRPIPDVVERIVDPQGRDLPTGQEGEILIAGPNVMKGYFNRPEETARALDARGFLHTGDMGRLDDDGYLFITGRIKEMLIIGGENVFPREIEEVLDKHPSVAASGVVGRMDPLRGEAPVAFVELREGHAFDEQAIRAWCRAHLAGYKVPENVVRLDALPRNATGKILRRELKKLVTQSD